MHICLTVGAIFFSLVHQLNCDNRVHFLQKRDGNVVPSAPHNLTVKRVTSTEIHLTWAKPNGYLTQATVPQHSPLTVEDHSSSKRNLVDIKASDILSNRDSALISVLKDTTKRHSYTSRLIKNEQTSNEAKVRDRNYAEEDADDDDAVFEARRPERERYYRRRKKRRDALTTVTEEVPTTTALPVIDGVKDMPNDEEDSSKVKSSEVTNNERSATEYESLFINYVLFYEEGLPGGVAGDVWRGGFTADPPQRPAKVREVVLAHQDGRDGLKGVKYTLRGLKSHTHYRIWVRAYFTDPESRPSVPPASSLSPPSDYLVSLTDAAPPPPPTVRDAYCDQPPGTLQLAWSRPTGYEGTVDAYEVVLRKAGGGTSQSIRLEMQEEHIETATGLPVDLINNVTLYEVVLRAFTKSVVYPGLWINGSDTEPLLVTMTADCVGLPMLHGGRGAGLGAPAGGGAGDDIMSRPELGYVVLALAVAVLLAMLSLYRCGCATAFKKCYPMSYLFLEEGGSAEGCGESGPANKPDTMSNQTKKAVTSPAHAAIISQSSMGGGLGRGDSSSMEYLWDPQHPPVKADMFLAHTAALHQDGDIGFSKEYELIQAKSALLGHTSHHSQHPDNRHKNRYLNITAYDHSRVCLLPSSGCSCDPGKDHRRSCTSKPSSPTSGDSSPHYDYVNANFIDGIVAEIDVELAKFIIEQNEKRKVAQRKKIEAEEIKSEIESKMSEKNDLKALHLPIDLKSRLEASSLESKIPSGFNTVDPRISLGPFESKIMGNSIKEKMTLDLNAERRVTSPGLEISPNTCRLSINLEKKEEKVTEPDVKSEKSIKETKGKKRSTSADTRDIIIDKKSSSRGHSKNSSVVVNNESPLNGVPKIEGAFLNIEFSGIVDSERELQKAREAERLEEANRLAKEAAEETLEDLDDLYVQIGGESCRVKSSWLLDRRRYIGTQGPTPGTLPAFWRMVWDHRVAVLVMITNLVERGRRKCDMYWPKEGTETYGAIQVMMLQEDVMATYTVRTFHIRNTKVGQWRTVLQYHYTVWPDHGTPEHPLAVLRFREAARRAAPPQAGSILVHCSAGVGRTGTYIVLDAMLNHLKLTGSLNVYGFLCHVRTQRNFLVQTEEQYVFIHDALLEAIQSGDTEVPAEQAKEYLKKLLENFPEGYVPNGGSLNFKCGSYGVPLSDKKEPIRNGDTNIPAVNGTRLRNVSTGESDFVMWDTDTASRLRDEARSEYANSMQNNVDAVSECNRIQFDIKNPSDRDSYNDKNVESANVRNDTVIDCDSNTKFVTLEIEDEKKGVNDISPELIVDDMDQKMIDFGDGLTNMLNKNFIIKNDKLNAEIKAETGSVNSMVKSDHSTSYEKLNGTCTKTSEESKASSMSNEEADLLSNENNSNDIRMNGNSNSKHDEVNAQGDHSNTISSISTDTNNLNNIANFRDRPNFSPKLESQDSMEVYKKDKNARIRTDDNYEVMSGNPRSGGGLNSMGTDSCFAGSHHFSCQRRDSGGRKPKNLLEQQFKLVTSFSPSKYHTVSAGKLANQSKNRRGAVWPVESGRVHLIPKPGVEGSDYVNATWLQGHRSLREYVVSQHPLPHTVEDVYRLLWDHSCQLLVMLTDNQDEECPAFWPSVDNPEISVYNYSVQFISQEKHVAKKRPHNPNVKSQPSPQRIEDEHKPISPVQSPSSSSINKGFQLKFNKGSSQRSSPVSPNFDDPPKSPNTDRSPSNSCLMRKDSVTIDDRQETGFYRQQSLTDNQDEERLIPKSEDTPSLECANEELKKLNSEPKTDGYTFDKSELRIDTALLNNDSSPMDCIDRLSPKNLANGDPFSPKDDSSKKSQTKSPSKISLKSLRLSSPVLRSPSKFKFEFGARHSKSEATDNDGRKSPQPVVEAPSFEPKFEMVPFKDPCQLRDGTEEIGKDCIITTTNLSMNSLQDEYELKVKLIECPKWLADLDYDENSDTDEGSEDEDYDLETKALDYVVEQRLKAYKGVFGLLEYIGRLQDEYKNSPVIVIDKYGGARATALCTLCAALRRNTRDVYSLAKLHHGRRPGVWRRPADLRALYEALAAYQPT